MTETTANHYDATLPAVDCYSDVTFYVSAEAEGMGTFYNPDTTNPFWAVTATDVAVVFEDDFETDQGWSVSGDAIDGQWDRGVPVGGGWITFMPSAGTVGDHVIGRDVERQSHVRVVERRQLEGLHFLEQLENDVVQGQP
jgi:hypothetical protein